MPYNGSNAPNVIPKRSIALALCISALLPVAEFRFSEAAEPELKELPRFPALDPAPAKASFVLREGFQIELAASEPNVASPVAMAFDESGRLFVVEMRDYSEHRDEKLGRIRMLEDTDNDGIFEKSTVFAENLAWPTAVICANGGIFVGSTPDIIFLRDRDGDGKADERAVVFTGFGKGVERLNVQQLFNSFNWGIDNRIHGATAGNGGAIQRLSAGKMVSELQLGSRDFSFSPRTLSMTAETGGGQHGLSFDDFGRKFICSNSSHIRMAVLDDRYIQGVSRIALPPGAIDIAREGPAAEVFRISPEEPWRTVRTQWRVSGLAPGPIEGGGRASGYFTGATGVTIYRGDAYPPEYRGNAFVGDAGGNLVHRKILHANGVPFEASRPEDELNREFMASRDTWFRPVQFANGPDGCLYVIDMYREVIEHPWSLPPNLKRLIDLDSGRERGRIWRIVTTDFKRPAKRDFSKATTDQLVEALKSANGWTRDTASRLLCERFEKSAAPLIDQKIIHGPDIADASRAQGLWLLETLGELQAKHITACLAGARSSNSNHDGLVENALQLIEKMPADEQPALLKKVDEILGTSGARLVNQYAWTLGRLNIPDRVDRLVALAKQTDDPWIQAGVLVSARNDAAALFGRLTEGATINCSVSFLAQLARLLPPADLETAFARAGKLPDRAEAFKLAGAILEANRKNATLAAAKTLLAEARMVVERNPGTLMSVRAIELLQFDDSPDTASLMRSVFHRAAAAANQGKENSETQPAFISLLKNPKAAAVALVEEWANLPVPVRQKSLDLLLGRGEGPALVIDALKRAKLTRADLTASQSQVLRQHSSPAISRPALELLGKVDADRAAVIAQFHSALEKKGDLKAGEKIFTERCATCHRVAGRGFAVGPDLESVRGNGREYLLTHLVDPNREVNSRYVAYTAELRDGESVTGILARETDSVVTLRLPNAEEKSIPREKLARFTASTQSLMPVGLDAGLDSDAMASLLDFLQTTRQ